MSFAFLWLCKRLSFLGHPVFFLPHLFLPPSVFPFSSMFTTFVSCIFFVSFFISFLFSNDLQWLILSFLLIPKIFWKLISPILCTSSQKASCLRWTAIWERQCNKSLSKLKSLNEFVGMRVNEIYEKNLERLRITGKDWISLKRFVDIATKR